MRKVLNVILLPLATIFLISQGVFVSDAYAYLDPGSASIILQALVGVFIGVAITIKIYWHKLKFKFASLSRKSE